MIDDDNGPLITSRHSNSEEGARIDVDDVVDVFCGWTGSVSVSTDDVDVEFSASVVVDVSVAVAAAAASDADVAAVVIVVVVVAYSQRFVH